MANRNAKLQHQVNAAEQEARFKSLLAKRGGNLDRENKPSTSLLINRTVLQLENFTAVYPPVRPISTLRPLKTQDPDKIRQAIAVHLYGKYSTPAWLKNAWIEKAIRDSNHHHRFIEQAREWFICAATGGSLHKTYFKQLLTKQEMHSLLTSNYDTFREAVIYALAIQHKNPAVAARLASTKLINRTIGVGLISKQTREMVDFFCRYPELLKHEIDDLIDYLNFAYGNIAKFTLYGRTLESIKRKSEEWHREMIKYKGPYYEWEGYDLPNTEYTFADNEFDVWKFTQLLNTRVLTDEGIKQRHCVAGYSSSCRTGNISIWSMTLNGARKLTIEVLNSSHRIVQARGLANRLPRPDELKALKHWARSNNLSLSI